MYLFLLLATPLFLVHRSRSHSFTELLNHRKVFLRGFLWALIAGFIMFLLTLGFVPGITVQSLYLHGLLLYFFIPILFGLLPLLPQCLDSKRRRVMEPIVFEVQLSAFFIVFNIAIYLVHYGNADQFMLLYLPLFYLISIPSLARGLWRSRRFEAHWNVLSVFLFILIICAVPFTLVLHALLRPLLAWALGSVLLLLMLYFNKFLDHLEQGIQFRLNLELKIGPLVRFFSRK